MKHELTIEIPNDGTWDFIHRFRNFGEAVYLALRESCSVDIDEIDASTSKFMVRDIPAETTDSVCARIRTIAGQHFFGETVRLTAKGVEPSAGDGGPRQPQSFALAPMCREIGLGR